MAPRWLLLLLNEVTESLNERLEPETRASTPVRALRVARPRPPARVVLLEPPVSSLPHVPVPESDLARATSPTVTRLLTTVVTDPDLENSAAFALVTELVDFVARSRLDYVTTLVTESGSVCPSSVEGEPALSNPDALDIRTPRSYAKAIADEYSSQWQTAMDTEMASWNSTGTYVDEVPLPAANIVDGMWIFRLKRLPGSPPAFKARYVARGFSQRQGVDSFHTFSPTPKMTTLRVLLHVAAQRDYELHSLDFSTAFFLRRPVYGLRRPVYGLRHAPRKWHDTLRTTLAALGFAPSSADLSLFLRTDTTLPLFYILVYVNHLGFATADTEALALVLQRFDFQFSSPQPTPLSTGHSLSAPPSDESVEPSGSYLELVGCLICEAEIYAVAMAAQEPRWLTYLLTDLGERPLSPPFLYLDNKAMFALCREQRLEHRTKHIALRYFLARELQQCRQLRLSYVALQANTADVFTKALGSGYHQCFCTALGLVPTLPHLLDA
ncbi:unnamed protein product [Closterium sp. NIES-54]